VAPSYVQDPLLGLIVPGHVLSVGAFVIGQLAKDVEASVEVDIDSAAVVAGDLDLVSSPLRRRSVLQKGIATSPRPGTLTEVNAGLTAYPSPALSTRTRAVTRAGSESARRRAMRPPSELPTNVARPISRASTNVAINRSKKAGE
jgi:hypothetical protein